MPAITNASPSRLAPVLLASVFAVVGAACSATTADAGDAGLVAAKIEPLSPQQSHYGKSYAEWNAAWWQWYYRAPGTTHPVTDPTGKHCAISQDPTSPVFFLAGTSGGIAKRTCTIPAGKALFFPVINVASDNGGVPKQEWSTDAELEGFIKPWGQTVTSSYVVLDGVRYENLRPQYEVPITRFKYDVPAGDNIYTANGTQGVVGTVDPSFATGIYILLAPLSPGKHTIRFGGQSKLLSTPFVLDVSYDLTVE